MCPECGEALIAFELEGIEIDHCVNCGGTWLDHGEMAMMAERAGAEGAGGLSRALYGELPGVKGKGRCPRCNRALLGIVYGDDPSVQLDRCPVGHGLFFDKGEIKTVICCLVNDDDKEAGAVSDFFANLFKSELDGTLED